MKKTIITYLITSFILFIISLFIQGAIDLVDGDTYYAIKYAHVFMFGSALFTLYTLILWIIRGLEKKTSSWLNWIHYIGSVICITAIGFVLKSIVVEPGRYTDYSVYSDFENNYSTIDLSQWLVVATLTFVAIQILFLVNVFRVFLIRK